MTILWIDTLYDATRTFPFVLGRVPLRELELSITQRCSEPDPVIIERIQSAYRKAKEAQRTVEPEYLPSGEWKDDIPICRGRYISALNATTTRPLKDLFREFFRNEGIAGLWCYGYYDSILDIPEVLVMSQYFLMHAISPDFALFGEDRNWSRSLLPNFVLPEFASNAFDVVVNTGSLPEMARTTC